MIESGLDAITALEFAADRRCCTVRGCRFYYTCAFVLFIYSTSNTGVLRFIYYVRSRMYLAADVTLSKVKYFISWDYVMTPMSPCMKITAIRI